jgi:hypothetical protein
MRSLAIGILGVLAIGMGASCTHKRIHIESVTKQTRDDRWLLYSSDLVITIIGSDEFSVSNDYRKIDLERKYSKSELEKRLRASSSKRIAILLPLAWKEREVISEGHVKNLAKSAASRGASVRLIEEYSSGVWELSKPHGGGNVIEDYKR